MKKEYYTISEFAKIQGVSKQAVYKRLTTSLKDYVVIVDGVKCLQSEALQPLHQSTSTSASVNVKRLNIESAKNSDFDLVSFLKEQIEEKDKQIARLQENADEKDKYIQEQGKRLADLVEQSNQLQQNNQVLIKMLSGSTETMKEVVVNKEDAPDVEVQTNEARDFKEEVKEVNIEPEVKEEKKKGLFNKIFK